jgi:hypothetical protein
MIRELSAEEARETSLNCAKIDEYLEVIFDLIEKEAKEGRFGAHYTSEIIGEEYIYPIKTRLTKLGYKVTVFDGSLIDFVIEWY